LNSFNIRDIENLTGIKAHTLRAWEKRYGIILPPTPPGKHRQYDNTDLRHILKITALYHSGFKISKIANMSADEINAINLDLHKRSNFEVFINQLISFCMDMDDEAFNKLSAELIETMGEEEFYMRIIFPFLSRIGTLWTTGDIVPVQEHFASNLIRNSLVCAIDRLPLSKDSKQNCTILLCPSNEYHEIPLLFANFILRKNKQPTLYLGTDTDENTIEEITRKMGVGKMLVYMVTNFTHLDANNYLNGLAQRFTETVIFSGGPATADAKSQFSNLVIKKDLKELLNACIEAGDE
jgi:MerR family transcriptional regulator, light-induced transcriptional regulator